MGLAALVIPARHIVSRRAATEHGANSRVLKPVDRPIGMVGRIHNVGPVVESGDARINLFQGAEQSGDVERRPADNTFPPNQEYNSNILRTTSRRRTL